MSDTDTDDHDDESTVHSKSKPHLDPKAVIALAKSIPNCTRIHPPRSDGRGGLRPPSRGGEGDAPSSTREHSASTATAATSYFNSDSTSSYFSSLSRRLQNTFSSEGDESHDEKRKKGGGADAGDDARGGGRGEGDDDILSFLVSDAYSIERLAAEAEGKHTSTSELEGAGIARIDVYCHSGTAMTCRAIPTSAPERDDPAADGDEGHPDGDGPSFMHILSTPKKGNVSEVARERNGRDAQRGGRVQVRRIIKRKCTLTSLRRIFEQPPRLPEINEQIISMAAPEAEGDYDSDGASSTVSGRLRRRRQRRQQSKSKFAQLSREQRRFLKQQQIKYEKRMLRDEKVRQHVGNAILAAGMAGCEGADITSMRSLSLDESSIAASETTGVAASVGDSDRPASVGGPVAVESEAYRAQRAIQDRIEIADMGLAILMGEAQRLERIMRAMRERDRRGGGSDGGSQSGGSERGGRGRGGEDDTDRSLSTYRSTDADSDDGDSSAASEDSEARKLARLMQGCEVEYSFPHEYHDELEGALMGDDVEEEEDDRSSASDDSDDASRSSSKAAPSGRRHRGRSPPKGASRKGRDDVISPIVAIPTNGEGCVVLRENGTFDVVGRIPDVLIKKLFKKNGPLPDQIALGTLGRYYVHFRDGSFFFYGPPSLNKILSKSNKKQRRGKDRNRGKRGEVSVVSVAFGKKLEDFFVVRSDGSWEAHGDLPPGLGELMKSRKGRADLLWVALGLDGEWCVRSRNGRVWWEGVSDEADEALADVLAEDGECELRYIDFGTDETYFLLTD